MNSRLNMLSRLDDSSKCRPEIGGFQHELLIELGDPDVGEMFDACVAAERSGGVPASAGVARSLTDDGEFVGEVHLFLQKWMERMMQVSV